MCKYKFSVVIPAHNEEKYIGKCLHFIKESAVFVEPDEVQMIVVANRCTDRTAAVAEKHGAQVVVSKADSIAGVRNDGIKAAEGEIIVTIDADSVMTKTSLAEIRSMLECGKYIGGGAMPEFDRMSLGIFASEMYVALNLIPRMIKSGGALSGTMFWGYKRDFEAVGCFDEKLVSLEDMDFALRLKAYGSKKGKKYGTLKKSFVITSARKFDEFGDWYLIKNRSLTKRIFTGTDRQAADEFYYNVRSKK